MEFRALWPEPGLVEIEPYLAGLDLTARALSDRPFTVVNFVSSIDGRVSIRGRSGPLGDEGDKELFRGLRREVDAVMVGTGTLAIERYGRMIGDAKARERRRERGLTPEPIACTVTRSGEIALDIPMFDEPDQRVVIFAGADIDTRGVRAQVTVVEIDPDQLTFTAVLSRLRHDFGVRGLLCEGGPSVFNALLAEDVADQLFLSLSPQIAGGGDAPTIARGPALPEPAKMILEAILEREQTLFLRYARPN